MYQQVKNLANKVFSQYEGKMAYDDEHETVSLVCVNEIKPGKKVSCTASVGVLSKDGEWKFSVDGVEATFEILGGCGLPCRTIEDAEKDLKWVLKKYSFRMKEQMSLFEFDFSEPEIEKAG